MGNWAINFLLDKKNLVFDNKNTVEKKRILFLLLGAFIFLLLPSVVFGQVVINEIYYDVCGKDSCGGNKGEESYNEWVEIYNAGEEAVNLKEWQIKDASGSSCLIAGNDLFLNPGQFAVITNKTSTWDFWNIPNNVLKIALEKNIGGGLNNDTDKVILITPDDSSLEIEYGKGNIPDVKEGHSLERILAVTGDFVEQENPTPGRGVFIAFTPTSTATISPSPPHLTLGLTPTVIVTTAPTVIQSTPTPNPTPAKAVYQINEVKNEKGETLSSVKIYVDDQYIHHYAPEVLEFGNDYYCDDDKKVACGFGEHNVRLEKSGYQDWEEIKTIRAGDSYFLNPVMVLPSSTPTPTLALTLTPTLKAEKEESLLPTITPFLLNQNSSPSPFLFLNSFSLLPKKLANKEEIVNDDFSQVLGEQEEREKESSDWYFLVGAFYLGTSGWRLYKKGDNDIMEKRDFKEEK